MKLHYSPNSCALAVHIALEEAGADFELARIDYAKADQRAPAFLALNPLGRVPVLETGEGVLTEVPAILQWIAETHPAATLLPGAPFARARVAAFNALLSSSLHVAFAHYFRPERHASDETAHAAIRSKAFRDVAEIFTIIDERLPEGGWAMGDAFTTSDPYLYNLSRWLVRVDLSPSGFPRVQAHLERIERRPAVRRALEAQGLAAIC